MYQHVRLSQLELQPPGALLLVGGRMNRHVSGNFLQTRSARVHMIGEPLDWLPEHLLRIEVWGSLLAHSPPCLLVHGARPLGMGTRIPPVPVPYCGPIQLQAQVTRHHHQLLASSAWHHHYLLRWTEGKPGLYLLEGSVSGLSPPWLQVTAATPLHPSRSFP